MKDNDNIEMTHKEYRDLRKDLFGVKKFMVDGVVGCPYLGICKTVYKNNVYCKTLKYKKCLEYLVNKMRDINQKIRSKNQGHLNNDAKNGNLNINSKEISSINRNALLSDKKDARDNL